MKRRLIRLATSLGTAAALVVLGAVAAGADPTHHYLGTEYDLGGVTQPINGAQPAIDAKADQITAATDAMLRDVAAQRATLPFGSIDPDPQPRPQKSRAVPRPTSLWHRRPTHQLDR